MQISEEFGFFARNQIGKSLFHQRWNVRKAEGEEEREREDGLKYVSIMLYIMQTSSISKQKRT